MIVLLLSLLLVAQVSWAQGNAPHSVLSQGTWYRLAVAQEGVYRLDYTTLQAMGIDMEALNPKRIRVFGNPAGSLPELNSEARPDDLTETAVYVVGAEDGSFDEGDVVLFYGQEPTKWVLKGTRYERERNYYSDSTYYYLCVDGDVDGLRVGEQASLSVEEATAVIADFPDYQWHEEELMSPYSIGVNWFGEKLSSENLSLNLEFVFPNLVTDKALRIKTSVLGRVSHSPMYYSAWVNDNIVVDHTSISALSENSNSYGNLSFRERQFMLESDTASFTMSINPEPSNATLYLDYVEIFAWRQLKRVGSLFSFRLMPSQFGTESSAVWIQNVGANHWLWDVTDPMMPFRQLGRLSAGNLVFATDENVERRYVLFDPAEAQSVASWTPIPNQDLHAITEADMLILTSPVLWQQAQELADFHVDMDGLQSIVVDVNEIFNEFSTGTADPTGIRDFIRMVYQRSGGKLKYVTLFGRASFDFRNLLGVDLNLVPCYEKTDAPHREVSFCTDDYFGMMDDGEGEGCAGHVDLGIGRIPVATPAEAEAALRKIKHYCDLAAMHGEWKNNHLFVSDDEYSRYVDDNEGYERMMDTLIPTMNINKIYCGAYQKVSTSTGHRFPQVNEDMVRAFEKGLITMTYTGHGGVIALAEERIFGLPEITKLSNFDKMPFVFTATCEFSKYDNPLLVSAGEQLFLQPDGGAIAMLTTCRPTYGQYNVKMGKALTSVLYQRDEDGRPLRLGDIVRRSKSHQLNYSSQQPNGVSQNISMLLLGDPAMRLAIPEGLVRISKINGKQVNDVEIELNAMSMVTVEGEITTYEGTPDTQFNGELWLSLFDKKSCFEVPYTRESGKGGTTTVKYHKDVIYQGRASVTDGKFTVSFQIPKDIKPDFGSPRFSCYAYDSIRSIDASGCFNNLTLGGEDPSVVTDNEGPKIDFYWNTPAFVDGSTVPRQGVLLADLYDAQGIYHYDFSLGRNMMLNSDLSTYDNLIVNENYEPALNDFRRGRVVIPVFDLTPGTHEFTLKVWDTQDNPSEASLSLVVAEDVFLAQVRNYPNPFTEETWFTLFHEGEDGTFDLVIELFDIQGRHVDRLSKRVTSVGGAIEPIRWDGRDQSGQQLRSGIYLYRLTLTDEKGNSRSVSQRLVLSR